MAHAQQTEWVGATRGSRAKAIALWVVQLLAAVALLGAGMAKLVGNAEMVALFEAIGVGQWLRLLTGALEVAGALLLLVPALAGVGALLLTGVLVGAAVTELFVLDGGSVFRPLPLLLMVVIVAYARRERTLRLFGH